MWLRFYDGNLNDGWNDLIVFEYWSSKVGVLELEFERGSVPQL